MESLCHGKIYMDYYMQMPLNTTHKLQLVQDAAVQMLTWMSCDGENYYSCAEISPLIVIKLPAVC